MASDKCPAFQFYVDDWKGSRSVQRMTFAQRGMYLEMLVEQWDNAGEGLPDDPRACADLLGGTPEEWIAAWPVLRRKFVDRRATGRDGDAEIHQPDDFDASRRVINVKLEKQRAALKKFKRGASKGGQTRAATATRTATGTYEKVAPPAGLQPVSSRSPAAHQAVSSTSSSSSIPSSTPQRASAVRRGEDPTITTIAEDLMEAYPVVFAKCRPGSVYRTTSQTFERDWPNYYTVAQLYPDSIKLQAMLEVFLHLDANNRPGTPGQFRNMASECAERLHRAGWQATA